VPLEASRLNGLVNTRVGVMQEIGWDPEWEVNPKELKLVERIGACLSSWSTVMKTGRVMYVA
jgi:hypothetical protein